jgi:hypothetical protein
VLFPVRLFFRRNDEALRVETLRITQTKSLEMSSRTTIQRTISLRIAIFIGAKISLKSSELNRFSTRFSTKTRNKIGCKVSFARISHEVASSRFYEREDAEIRRSRHPASLYPPRRCSA